MNLPLNSKRFEIGLTVQAAIVNDKINLRSSESQRSGQSNDQTTTCKPTLGFSPEPRESVELEISEESPKNRNDISHPYQDRNSIVCKTNDSMPYQ